MLSGLIAGTATATLAPAAFGAAQWCEDDPLVVIKTPTGYQLPLHVTNYAEGPENQVYLDRVPDNQTAANAWISWTVVQSKKGGHKPATSASSAVEWDVTIYVTIHTDPTDGARFRTRTVASSDVNGTGVRYADAVGMSDRKMQMRFSLWA
ncbi:MAG TPA: hypothetical protein VFX49_21600 [Chloroflexota bacterium]|nr:hypothetical protein [Chloroflexota bacterium]